MVAGDKNVDIPRLFCAPAQKEGGATVGGGAVQITPSRLRYRYSEATPSLGKKGTFESGQSSPPIALAMNGGVARSAGVGVIKANDPHLTASGPLLRGRRTRRGADARFFSLRGDTPATATRSPSPMGRNPACAGMTPGELKNGVSLVKPVVQVSVAGSNSACWRLGPRLGSSTTRTVRLPIVRTTVRTTARTTSVITRRFGLRCLVGSWESVL